MLCDIVGLHAPCAGIASNAFFLPRKNESVEYADWEEYYKEDWSIRLHSSRLDKIEFSNTKIYIPRHRFRIYLCINDREYYKACIYIYIYNFKWSLLKITAIHRNYKKQIWNLKKWFFPRNKKTKSSNLWSILVFNSIQYVTLLK